MKLLMFGWEFSPSTSGGLGTACRGLSEGLLEEGAQVLFVVPGAAGAVDLEGFSMIGLSRLPAGDEDARKGLPAGLPEFSSGLPLNPYMRPPGGMEEGPPALNGTAEQGYRYSDDLSEEVSGYAACARKIARDTSFDVIVAHDWMAIPAALAAREESGRPLVVYIHSLESDRTFLRINEYIYGVERTGMAEADRIIAVSGYTKKKIIDQYGIRPEKISVIHNATLPFPAAASSGVGRTGGERQKNVLFLGRMTRQKGPLFFVQAAERVLVRDPSVRFIMVGDGHMMPEVRDRVAAAGIAHRFEFTGFLDREAVASVFARSDLYVMPSLSEPFGIAALEAILQGVPAILSKDSGVAEVLQSCPTVTFGDIEGLAELIMTALFDEGLRRSMLISARKDMEWLSWSGQARRVMELCRSLAQV